MSISPESSNNPSRQHGPLNELARSFIYNYFERSLVPEDMPVHEDAPGIVVPQPVIYTPGGGDFISTYTDWADVVELPRAMHEAIAMQLVAALLNRNGVQSGMAASGTRSISGCCCFPGQEVDEVHCFNLPEGLSKRHYPRPRRRN